MSELDWHFDIPFWEHYSLKPRDVAKNPEKCKHQYDRTMKSDLACPLDVMFWKNHWLLLDGLHRLLKAQVLGMHSVKVRKVSESMIPKITK